MRANKSIESANVLRREIGRRRDGLDGRRRSARCVERVVEARDVGFDPTPIQRARVGEIGEQTVEQQDVHAQGERQMQIGCFGGDGAARVDVDDLRSALLARRHQALIEHRVAPGHVAADLNDEIGFLQILVAARHDILAEGAHMARHRGRHAEPRIGVDIPRTDETLHQLVGDVIVFGQELAGDIEGDRIRPMRIADARELR